MLLNIDFDGVLVPNTHETTLMNKSGDEGLSLEDTSPIWDWYDRLVNMTSLPINHSLLQFLYSRKEMGDTIRLWTNRAYTLRTPTLNNLGPYTSIFDSSSFYGGRKSSYKVEGIVLDNDVRNLTCGETGILYKF
jgi:hypothetical protein